MIDVTVRTDRLAAAPNTDARQASLGDPLLYLLCAAVVVDSPLPTIARSQSSIRGQPQRKLDSNTAFIRRIRTMEADKSSSFRCASDRQRAAGGVVSENPLKNVLVSEMVNPASRATLMIRSRPTAAAAYRRCPDWRAGFGRSPALS